MSSNDNCKVHFAGSDNSSTAVCALRANDARYRLFTAYPFISVKKDSYKVGRIIEAEAGFKHIIVDSGLFTLMFGSKKGAQLSKEDMRDWMHRIVQFANENRISNASYVECDCQKIIGPKEAWNIRREMKALMGGREVINVFHLEDGPDGFDELVRFSDYIAISVPELRINKPKQYKEMTTALAKRARKLKPSIKIHLLGCTEKNLLQSNKFVTSADSSSWLSPARYGWFGDKKTNNLSDAFKKQAWDECWQVAKTLGIDLGVITEGKLKNTATYYLSASWSLSNYRQWCGPQE